MRGTITRLSGHQQITDAYLIALAEQNRGRLATMDRGTAELGSARSLELINNT